MAGIVGNAEIHSGLPVVIGNMVVATLEATGQKAWIAEFGSGSQMAKDGSNPYLSEYQSSSNYNPLRPADGTIVGRRKGQYYDLDGKPQYSSGRNAGKDLELKPVVTTIFPMHTIQHEIDSEMPELIMHLRKTVEDYALQSLTMDVNIYL